MCEYYGDLWPMVEEPEQENDIPSHPSGVTETDSIRIRDAIMQYLQQH